MRDAEHDLRDAVSIEGPLPGDQLVGHDAERKDVDPVVDVAASQLLRREVPHRAEAASRLGELAFGLEQLRDAEVHDADLTIREHAQVAGLHIPMDHATPVSEQQAVRDLSQPADHGGRAKGLLALDLAVQVLPVEVFLHDVRLAVLLAKVVNCDDVGMAQVGGDLGLARKSLAHGRFVQAAGLDSDVALEYGIIPAEDPAEAALADGLEDLILAEGCHSESRCQRVRARQNGRCFLS